MITRKLKIGDKIRCIKENKDLSPIKRGDIFTVKSVTKDRCTFDIKKPWSFDMTFDFADKYFELVEEEKSNNSMKYKVGDKVRVKSIEWYNENKNKNGNVEMQKIRFCEDMPKFCFSEKMSKFCDKEVTIRSVDPEYNSYFIEEAYCCDWTDEMFEDGVIEEPKDVEKTLSKQGDSVNHPSHYTWLKDLCGIEVIDITRHMDFNLGNAIKYILRCGHKSEQGMTDKEKTIEDLKKAEFYIKDKTKMLEETK